MKNQICRVLLIVSSVALLAPAGCVFETGVGDPKKSTVDRNLTGYWKTDTELVTVVALDESTCLVDWMSFEGTGTSLQPAHRVINRGWLTSIDGAEYLTLEMLVPKSQQRKKYAVMKLQIDGDTVIAKSLHEKFAAFKKAGTPVELEKAIRKHQANATAFHEANVYRKTTAAATAGIRKAFNSE